MTCPKCSAQMEWVDWDFELDEWGRVTRKYPPQWVCECGWCMKERGPNDEPTE